MKKTCIFCKIIAKEIEEVPIWESGEFIAYLDRCPITPGMCMVMPKKHFESDILKMPPELLSKYFEAVKEVEKLLKKKLKVKRVTMVAEGLGVNHAHIKLYPIHGLKKNFEEIWSQERVFFDKYPGYITTQLGPELSREELKKIAIKFIS